MREIKFSYMYQEEETGAWMSLKYTLEDVERGRLWWTDFGIVPRHTLVARRQYTGLKDAKGVEIYEGDIVLVAGLGVVEVKITPDYGVIYENPELFCDNSYSDSAMEGDFPEILGNIYENPELLNGRMRRE